MMSNGYHQEYLNTNSPRRHSMFDGTLAPQMRNRSHSLGLVNVSGFSPGISPMSTSYMQNGPATPCFMNPRMAFTPQFGYDSPIEIMTSGSGAMNVFDPRSVSRLRRCSLRRLSRKWKIVLILLFSAIGTGLFITKKMHDASKVKAENAVPCTGDKHECEDEPHDHPGLAERFMDVVSLEKIQKHFHTLTQDLGQRIQGAANPTLKETQEGTVLEHPTEDVKSLEHASDEDIHYLDRQPRNADPQMAYQTVEEMDTDKQQRSHQARKIVVATNKDSSNPRLNSGRGKIPNRSSGKPSRPVRIPPGVNPRRYGL